MPPCWCSLKELELEEAVSWLLKNPCWQPRSWKITVFSLLLGTEVYLELLEYVT